MHMTSQFAGPRVSSNSATESHDKLALTLIGGAIAVCLLLQLHLVFNQPVNWDEFRFLADVHSYERGELSAPLLTFQVHLFSWLTGIGNEVSQIRFARLIMMALELATLALIAAAARRFFGLPAAICGALAYISFSFVLQHGASFRFDPLVTFWLMAGVYLLLGRKLRWTSMLIVGLSLAMATMISIKIALALPLVAAIGIYRIAAVPNRRTCAKLAVAALSAAVFLAILYAWHLSTLAGASNEAAEAHLGASYSKTLREIPFFPRLSYFLRSLIENPLHWLLLLLGISAVLSAYRRDRKRALLLLSFLLPLLSVLFYRNAFPYFYSFVLAPAAVLFAAAADRLELRRLIGPIAVLLAAGGVIHQQRALSDAAQEQRQTVAAVHRIFPNPVSYLDRCSMIASFPQAGLFMSSWWIENYVAAGRPVMRELLIEKAPVFVIADSPLLADALEGPSRIKTDALFLPDSATLHSNYVHHWGPIWVAGKALNLTEAGRATEFLIPGRYKLESAGPIRLDGQSVHPGASLLISAGAHRLTSSAGDQSVILRWAAAGPVNQPDIPRRLEFGRF